ncbi:MAG TPA: hypothetical protein PLY60_01040 [Bacillota bacterium]|nr:hypothetical protein [Bacillota bacterium]
MSNALRKELENIPVPHELDMKIEQAIRRGKRAMTTGRILKPLAAVILLIFWRKLQKWGMSNFCGWSTLFMTCQATLIKLQQDTSIKRDEASDTASALMPGRMSLRWLRSASWGYPGAL